MEYIRQGYIFHRNTCIVNIYITCSYPKLLLVLWYIKCFLFWHRSQYYLCQGGIEVIPWVWYPVLIAVWSELHVLLQGNPQKGFGRCRLSCLLHCMYTISIPLHTNVWDDISRTFFMNSPVPLNSNWEYPCQWTKLLVEKQVLQGLLVPQQVLSIVRNQGKRYSVL